MLVLMLLLMGFFAFVWIGFGWWLDKLTELQRI